MPKKPFPEILEPGGWTQPLGIERTAPDGAGSGSEQAGTEMAKTGRWSGFPA